MTWARCPHPQKARFYSNETAKEQAGRLSLAYGQTVSCYPCRCGMYHLTTQTSDELTALIDRLVLESREQTVNHGG